MNTLDAWFIEVLAISWRAGLLIICLVGIRFIVRRYVPAGMMFALWVLLAGVLLVPWRAPLPAGWGQRVMAMAFPPKPLVSSSEAPAQSVRVYDFRNPRVDAPRLAVARAVERENVKLGDRVYMQRSWFEYALLIWGFVGAVLLVIRTVATVGFWRCMRRDAQNAELKVARVLEHCGTEIGLRELPEVKTTGLVGSPALGGFWRPCLLMPPGLANKLSESELAWVVAHELAHLRRRDLWAQGLLQAACIVHWFNPLVWWAARLARHDCELACDEFVLRHALPEEREDYGYALLKMMGLASGGSRLPSVIGISESKRHLLRRIGMIAHSGRRNWRHRVTGTVLLGTLVVVGYTREVPANAVGKPHSAPLAPTAAVTGQGEFRPTGRPAQSPEEIARREAYDKVRREWESQVKFELRAVDTIGGVAVAIIDMNGQPQAAAERSHLLRWSVDRIDPLKKTVVLTKSGEPARELTLSNPSDVHFAELDEARRELVIKNSLSRYRQYPLIPREVESAWGRMSREAKEAILVNFMNNGIIMTRFIEPNGSGGGNTSLLFGQQISEMRQRDMAKFLDSLSPQQREKYHGGGMPVVNFTAPAEEQRKQYDRGKAAAENQAEVIAELTAEQRKLYDAMQVWSSEVRPAKRI